MPHAIETRLRHAYLQMGSGALDELLELYEPDAVIQSANQAPVAGAAAIRAFWMTTFNTYRVELVPEVLELAEFGEVAIIRGRAAGRLVARAGGDPIAVDTWFMQVYRRGSDGTWRFWRGTNGPNPRRSETAKDTSSVRRSAPT
jgi:ketosteroid isomerase-like protein